MAKKCILCNEDAEFRIKDTSDYYCKECAEDSFADLSVLLKVEDEAQRLKSVIEERIDEGDDSE